MVAMATAAHHQQQMMKTVNLDLYLMMFALIKI